MKSFHKKANDSNGDVYAFLLAYWETGLSGCGYSPAEMLFGRRLRSKTPKLSSTLVSKVCEPKTGLQHRQSQQREHDERGTKSLKPLQFGDNGLVRSDKQSAWKPAVVLGRHSAQRSYLIDEGRQQLRSNRVHLRRTSVAAGAAPEVLTRMWYGKEMFPWQKMTMSTSLLTRHPLLQLPL